LKLIVEMF